MCLYMYKSEIIGVNFNHSILLGIVALKKAGIETDGGSSSPLEDHGNDDKNEYTCSSPSGEDPRGVTILKLLSGVILPLKKISYHSSTSSFPFL